MWVEVFAVFVVCHLIGDFALQLDRMREAGRRAAREALESAAIATLAEPAPAARR